MDPSRPFSSREDYDLKAPYVINQAQAQALRSLATKAAPQTPCAPSTKRDIPQQLDMLDSVIAGLHQMQNALEQRLFTVTYIAKEDVDTGGACAPSSENIADRIAQARLSLETLMRRGGSLIDRLQV